MREFCTKSELSAHKQSPCEPPTVDQNNSMPQYGSESVKVELNDVAAITKCDEQTGASSSQMENKIDNGIAIGSHNQYNSMVSQMQRMNSLFPVRKKITGPFGCEICGRIFNKKCNMTKHLMIHNGEYPFECWLCHKM